MAACVTLLAVSWATLSALQVRSSPQSPPEIPTGPHVILGRVIDARTNQPIGGAVVTLLAYHGPPGAPLPGAFSGRSSNVSAPRNVLTTASGDFVFRDLPAGRYAIEASAFGYASGGYRRPDPAGPVHLIELADGRRPAEIPVRLWKFAAITGTVLDDQGEPVVGAPVSALRPIMSGDHLMLRSDRAEAQTDDRGVYRLARLVPGRYVVGVISSSTTLPADFAARVDATAQNPRASGEVRRSLLPTGGGRLASTGEGLRVRDRVLQRSGPVPPPPGPDGRLLAYASSLYPGTARAAEATVIAVGPGEERTGIDIPLRLSPAVHVSGIATGPDGPMANLVVRLVPPAGVDVNNLEPDGVLSALTDERGAFTFLAVPPAQYALKASVVADPFSPALWASQPLNVNDRDVVDLAVTMRPGIPVRGRLQLTNSNGSSPPDLQRLSAIMRPVGAQLWRAPRLEVESDGSLASAGNVPGRYNVVSPDSQGWIADSMTQGGQPVVDDILELGDTAITDLVVTFSNTPSRVSGSIADASGARDVATNVLVIAATATTGEISSRRVCLTAATPAATFDCVGLPPGDYVAVAVPVDTVMYLEDPGSLGPLIEGATRFTLAAGETKSLALRTFSPRGR